VLYLLTESASRARHCSWFQISDTQSGVTTDAALRLLSAERRRAVLRSLDDRDGTLTVEHLVTALAPRRDSTVDDDRTELTIELRHVHLPPLAEENVIEYDPERGVVDRGRHFAEVASLLSAIGNERSDVPAVSS